MKVPILISLAFVNGANSFLSSELTTTSSFQYQQRGSAGSSSCFASVETPQSPVVVVDGNDNAKRSEEENNDNNKIRPIHQNWWPVSSTYYLDKSKPNPVDLLNQKLVLFWSEEEKEWKCLDDRCSHRFAPLSEGRVVNNNCIQCAYHGWEFNGKGKCLKVPQAKSATGGRPITSYPVRVEATMVFVWADPASYETLGKSVSIPIFPALEEAVETRGESICFMRDLPYGYELLGENLLDLSHLPFSHHGVGALTRDLGCPLPFQMLSASQKSKDGPLYEATLEDAATSDPTFKGMGSATPPDASLNLGFYEPSHVRYTRQWVPGQSSSSSYVSLYLCPTSTNKARVFLFNIFPKMPPPPKQSLPQRIKSWVKPSGIKKKVVTLAAMQKFKPYSAHMIMHQIFDGDGIFLHKQGDRMQRAGLSFKDYDTPSSADVMVNAFRRYSQSAGQKTSSLGLKHLADSVMPSSGYLDNLPRSEMLDRYESHTKHCGICSKALKEAQTKKRRLEILEMALIGATGASSTTFLGALGLALFSQVSVPLALIRIAAGATASCLGGYKLTSQRKPKVEKEIQQFLFEDYIHADKH